MKVYVKIYKFCDADFYAINGAGISVASLMKLVLAYRAAEKDIHIFIPQCLPYDVSGKKRCIPLEITVTDPASIAFLKKEIKPRQRTAFLKTILRQALMDQMTGVFLKNKETIIAENKRIAGKDFDGMTDILYLRPGMLKRDYFSLVEKPTIGHPEKFSEQDTEEEVPKTRNRFGDVGDLAVSRKKKEKTKNKRGTADTAASSDRQKDVKKEDPDKDVKNDELNVPADVSDIDLFGDSDAGGERDKKETVPAPADNEPEEDFYDDQDDLFSQFENI